jgi:oligopeptide/dipeptide ABC transporter ATP-binding protein
VADLRLDRLTKAYGDLPVLGGVSLTVASGELVAVVGPSGCGKSTLFDVVAGLERPDAGRVLVDGADATGRTDAFAYMPQQDLLFPWRTVLDNTTLGLEVAGMRRRAARERARPLFAEFGLDGFEGVRPDELSGGMRQRAAIAMALACNPKVLIADEPTTALDVMVQAQILELLDGLCRDFGLALVLVTHDLPVVAQLCNRCAVMYAGEIVERGPLEAIYHTPGHPYSRMLFAASPDLAGLDEPVLSIAGAPPRLDRAIEGCPFAPRCDSVFDACVVRPRLEQVAADHDAACHLNSRVPA